MKIHDKKILETYYTAVADGSKTFELRKDDDDYEVGDTLILREYDGKDYTGRYEVFKISYILRNCPEYGLENGYAILGIQR